MADDSVGCSVVVGDMVVALSKLQRPEPEDSDKNVFIEPLSDFFIVQVV